LNALKITLRTSKKGCNGRGRSSAWLVESDCSLGTPPVRVLDDALGVTIKCGRLSMYINSYSTLNFCSDADMEFVHYTRIAADLDDIIL